MRKTFLVAITALYFVLSGCGGSASAETPESIVKKWCELNAKVRQAESGSEEKEKAKEERRKFEEEIETKYKDNKEFYDKIDAGTKECDQ